MGAQLHRRFGARYQAWVATSTASEAVDNALYFALAWTASAYGGAAAGWVLAAVSGPRVVLTLVGGLVTDRVGPRPVVVAALVALGSASALAAVLVAAIGTPLALLVGFAALLGAATAFLFPATNTMIARAVALPDLPRAMSLRQLGFQVADLVGRPLGGLLVGLGGIALVLWTNAATFLLLVGAVLLLRLAPNPAAAGAGSVVGDLVSGVRTAWAEPALRTVLGLYALAAGCALPIGSLLLPLVVRDRAWTATTAGLLAGAIGLGATATALVIARAGTHPRTAAAIAAGLAACGAGGLLLVLAPTALWAAAGGLAHGAGLAVFIAHGGPVLVARSPATHIARVQAVLGVVQGVALLVLTPLLGALAGIDPRLAAAPAAGLLGAGALIAARSSHLGFPARSARS